MLYEITCLGFNRSKDVFWPILFSFFLMLAGEYSCPTFASNIEASQSNDNSCQKALVRERKLPALVVAVSKIADWAMKNKTVSSKDMIPLDEFFKSENGEVIVGINGFRDHFDGKVTEGSAEELTGKNFDDNRHVFHADVNSPDAFVDRLLEIYAKAGPIQRLVVIGHGSPGSTELGFGQLNNAWANSSTQLKNLPDDLFKPDATVVLLSCGCAAGYSICPSYGINSIRNIFSKLMKQGGQVVASRKTILMDVNPEKTSDSLLKMSDAELKAIAIAGLPIAVFMAIEKGLGLFLYDWKTVFGEAIVRIDIPPQEQFGVIPRVEP